MRAFRLLSMRRLRQAPLRAIIAVVAVASGITLAVAILITQASVERSVEDYGRALGGPAPLRIVGATSRAGLQQVAIDAAEGVDGVAAVIPMVQVTSQVDFFAPGTSDVPGGQIGSHPLLVIGVDCRALGVVITCDPNSLASTDEPLAVGPGMSRYPGLDTSMRTDTGRVTLTGVPVIEELAALNDGWTVVLPLDFAQAVFAQPGLVDVAYVQPDDGADLDVVQARLQDAIGPQNGVLQTDDPPPELEVALRAILPLFTLLGLFGLGTGAVLVRNTVALSLEERRRQMAITAAVGGDSRTLIGGTVAEAAILGVVGGIVGIAGGMVVAGPIVNGMSSVTESIVGLEMTVHVPGSVVLVGALLGAVVAGLSALGPARRAARLDVAAELSGRGGIEEARPIRLYRRVAVWAGIALVATGLCWLSQDDGGIEPWQAAIGPLAFLAVTVSLLLANAAAAPILIGWVGERLLGRRGAATLLSIAELTRDPRRVGIMAVAIASPIVTGFATEGFVTSARASISASFADDDPGVAVSTIDVNEGIDAFVTPTAIEALKALPGVAGVDRGYFLSSGHRVGDLVGVGTYDGIDPSDWDFVRGEPDPVGFEAGEVLVGPALARRDGARPGDTIELATPGGMATLTVQGVVESDSASGFSVFLSTARFEELFGQRGATFLSVRTAPGVTEEELASTIRAARGSIDPVLRVSTTDELVRDIGESVDARMFPFRVMQQALLLVAFVAVLSTLLLVGLQRRREHGLLAAVGADPASLRGMVALEAAVVAGAAIVVSLIEAPLVLWCLLQVVPLLIGVHNPFHPNWAAFVGSSVVALVVTLLAATWPALRAAKVEVLEALRYE